MLISFSLVYGKFWKLSIIHLVLMKEDIESIWCLDQIDSCDLQDDPDFREKKGWIALSKNKPSKMNGFGMKTLA